MANANAVQPRFPTWIAWSGCALIAALVLGYYASILLGPVGTDPANPIIVITAIPLILWPFCALYPSVEKSGSRARRLLYSALGMLLVFHVAIAYHLGHGWSHRDAFDRTERISGFGPGIYVSYLFVGVWVADAIWAWVAFDRYLSRSRWLSWAIVGIMGFVWFNAVIVFGSWMFRIVAIWMLLMLWGNNWYIRCRARAARAARSPLGRG